MDILPCEQDAVTETPTPVSAACFPSGTGLGRIKDCSVGQAVRNRSSLIGALAMMVKH